jgi:phosphoglycerate kinase
VSITKIDDCVGVEAENQSNSLEAGKILLLENLRFHKEETEDNLEFAKKLALLGDVYVNDAFSVCHRAHASITGLPQLLDSCAGLLLEKEINNLNKVLKNPEKPMTAIVGGTKVKTKAKFIDKISEVADCVIVSGLIKKEIEEKNIEFKYAEKIIGPTEDLTALDIDQKMSEIFREKILQSKTVLWNGPFGKFEEEKYAAGTLAIAYAIIESKAFSVIGGGETVEFLQKQGILDKFSHVSTGGGAMLNYLSGDKLPGLVALEINEKKQN